MTATAVKIRAEIGQATNLLLQDMPYDAAKVKTLRGFGFENSENVRDFDDHQKHHKDALYYRNKYPLYKFITLHQMEKIREKYKLETKGFSRFKGDIPARNIEDMANFSIDREDLAEVEKVEFGRSIFSRGGRWGISNEYYEQYLNALMGVPSIDVRPNSAEDRNRTIPVPRRDRPNGPRDWNEAFETKAQKMYHTNKDGKSKRMSLADIVEERGDVCQITAEPALFIAPDPDLDPIVTVGVKRGFLIVTAWGAEASDPDVINPAMN